jgi:Radical SAM superfamily/4Fe-4S single cluster domain
MTQYTDTFCWRPYTDMVLLDNFYKPCCYYTKNLKFESVETANLEIRNDIKENRWNSGCDICRITEKDGNTNSHRFKYFGEKNPTLFEENKFSLQNLEINIDNNCNIACITCDSGNSSRWAAENRKMQVKDTKQPHSINLDNILLKDLWLNVKKLTLYGGEPMYSKKVDTILTWLVENDLSANINLEFFTNGTIFNENILNLFSKFNEIRIGFSIDGIYEHFNIIRWPAKWETVVENYNKIKKLSNVHVYKIYTFSLLNACYTANDLQVFSEVFGGITVSNLLIYPKHFAARNLPYHIKSKVIDELKNIPNFSMLISELQQPSYEEHLVKALKQLRFLDSYRKTDSSILFPTDVWSLADK